MKPQLSFPIPERHVAHWTIDGDKVEVEMLRFLTPGEAKLRALVPWNKGLRTSWAVGK